MGLTALVGYSQAVDGREAGLQAMRQALDQVGRLPVAFGWVIASHVFALQDVLNGAADLLGNVSLLGFSSSAELSAAGRSHRSVVVALLCSDEIQCRAGWWPDFAQDSRACIQMMLQSLRPDSQAGESLLLVADGMNGDAALLSSILSDTGLMVAGCLAGGELWRGRTFQLGGRASGSGGLAAAALGGNVVIGAGVAHGWRPVGALSRLTRVQGQWVRTLDDQPASETYARLFGRPAREWSHPPLNDLVRLYPLGVQEAQGMKVRSPLRVEVDGSLRMNTTLPEGGLVDILVGSQKGCQQAATQATLQALAALGPTRPRLAILLVDMAWQSLLELDAGAEVVAVRRALGEDVPVMGGYTLGQIARPTRDGPVELFNQHILVLLFGSKTIEGEEIHL
jgi:hypothetical protein